MTVGIAFASVILIAFGSISLVAYLERKRTNELIKSFKDLSGKMKTVMGSGTSKPEDKAICNSVITKCLLALDRETRDKMIEYMKRASGIDIRLDHCQHSLGVIS